ncbi:MAG: 50S ribosomal protein L32 [Anaerolineales bacterium]|nr:MAG: 50S ribosomal protein L32 [Anaerolineales bacterium]
MGAVPKRRISSARRGNRRAHWRLRAPHLVRCSDCGAPVRPHHVCMACGKYRGQEIVEIETE